MPFQVQFERCRYAKCTQNTHKHTHRHTPLYLHECVDWFHKRLILFTVQTLRKSKKREIALCSLHSFHLARRFRVHSVRSISSWCNFFNPLILLLPESWKLIEMDSFVGSWVRWMCIINSSEIPAVQLLPYLLLILEQFQSSLDL